MQPSITHRAARRMLRYKVAGGVLDFIGIAGCTFLILVLLVLLINLVVWVQGDLAQVFSGYFKNVTDAVVMPR
ncbi:hypothetical protein AGMMS49992_01280 [Clostridia bacterium]|nr:hypothetical protein AGMMS49992_01280 [Clostridia bacterium]